MRLRSTIGTGRQDCSSRLPWRDHLPRSPLAAGEVFHRTQGQSRFRRSRLDQVTEARNRHALSGRLSLRDSQEIHRISSWSITNPLQLSKLHLVSSANLGYTYQGVSRCVRIAPRNRACRSSFSSHAWTAAPQIQEPPIGGRQPYRRSPPSRTPPSLPHNT